MPVKSVRTCQPQAEKAMCVMPFFNLEPPRPNQIEFPANRGEGRRSQGGLHSAQAGSLLLPAPTARAKGAATHRWGFGWG